MVIILLIDLAKGQFCDEFLYKTSSGLYIFQALIIFRIVSSCRISSQTWATFLNTGTGMVWLFQKFMSVVSQNNFPTNFSFSFFFYQILKSMYIRRNISATFRAYFFHRSTLQKAVKLYFDNEQIYAIITTEKISKLIQIRIYFEYFPIL